MFNGSPRYLEIGVRPAGNSSPYNILAPRQQVTSIPYVVHSLNATQLGGLPATSFVQANASGNVGIGTAILDPGVKLQVNGNTRITAGGSGGYLQIGTPDGESGLGVIGSNRFDLRFDGATLTLAATAGTSPPPAEYGMTLNTLGNIGIGMGSPLLDSQWKLEVNGPVRLTPGGSGERSSSALPMAKLGWVL